MNAYLQPTAAAILLLLGSGLAGMSTAEATLGAPTPAAVSPIGVKDKPIFLAENPESKIQLGGEREREREPDQRLHRRDEKPQVVVPGHERETTGSGRDEHRDRDSDRHDRE